MNQSWFFRIGPIGVENYLKVLKTMGIMCSRAGDIHVELGLAAVQGTVLPESGTVHAGNTASLPAGPAPR